MYRQFTKNTLKALTSGVLAASLLATPVHAGESRNGQDTAAIIATLFGLVAIGTILSESNKNDDRGRAVKHTHHDPYRYTHTHSASRDHTHRHRPAASTRRVPKHLRLPEACYRTFRMQRGNKEFYGSKCLTKNFRYASRLPQECRDTIVARNKRGTYVVREIYRPVCLHKRGYRTTKRY